MESVHAHYIACAFSRFAHAWRRGFCTLVHSFATGSGVFVGLLGVAYYAKIHNITYFILVQIGVGMFEVRP